MVNLHGSGAGTAKPPAPADAGGVDGESRYVAGVSLDWCGEGNGSPPGVEVAGVKVQIASCSPRDAATAPLTRQVLDASLEGLGVIPDTRTDIAFSLSDACAHVIQHADHSDEYELRARVNGA